MTSSIDTTVIGEAYSEKEKGPSITLKRLYRNFTHWYVIETDYFNNGKLITLKREFFDTDKAFNYYDKYIVKHNLVELKSEV